MEEKKTHWKRLVNPDYLGVYSLDNGNDMTLTISKVTREVITSTGGKKEECTVVYFKEAQKPMILNRTNAKIITKIYDTPYIQEWEGHQITLFASKTKLAGEMVECLRIREKIPSLTIEEKRGKVEKYANKSDDVRNGILTYYSASSLSDLTEQQINEIYDKKNLR